MSQGEVHPLSYRQTQSIELNTGVGLDQEQEQHYSEPYTQPEFNQWTFEPGSGPPVQAIEFRIKQLHNRRVLLLKMQRLGKKAGDSGVESTEEMTCEDSDRLCELEAIQRELEELMVKKEEVEKKGKHSKLRANEGQQDAGSSLYKTETPRGGIYILPPPQQEDRTAEKRVKARPVTETPTGPVVPVDSLGWTPAVTKCPFCEEVVLTETSSRVGEAAWMSCCLCTLAGCVAGCCLIPFFTRRTKNVHHQCPRCQENIHIQQPF
ncbi:uncharacterized protein LOC144459470 [Epinephelus lanceolatus]